MAVDGLLQKRIVLMTGKGGVGRTTVTVALARLAREHGHRVLVAEIGEEGDDYSPLARHFGRERLPDMPAELEPGIKGCVLLPRTGQEQFLSQVLRVGALARAALGSEAITRLRQAAPSFREMGVFFQLLTCLREKQADGAPAHTFVLVDMPATGHALALTGLPAVLLRLVPGGPIADALREGQAYLNNPKLGVALVVTLPETLPVSESLELIEGLQKSHVTPGAVIVNRVPDDPFTAAERAALEPALADGKVFGSEGFRRPENARREIERLAAGAPKLARYELPERQLEGKALIAALSFALGRGPQEAT